MVLHAQVHQLAFSAITPALLTAAQQMNRSAKRTAQFD